ELVARNTSNTTQTVSLKSRFSKVAKSAGVKRTSSAGEFMVDLMPRPAQTKDSLFPRRRIGERGSQTNPSPRPSPLRKERGRIVASPFAKEGSWGGVMHSGKSWWCSDARSGLGFRCLDFARHWSFVILTLT